MRSPGDDEMEEVSKEGSYSYETGEVDQPSECKDRDEDVP